MAQHLVERPASAPASVRSRLPIGIDRWCLAQIQQHLAPSPVRFVLWDGRELPAATGAPVASVHVKDRGTLLRLMWDPEYSFAEAFSTGRIEVRGDLVALIEACFARGRSAAAGVGYGRRLWRRGNTLRRSRSNVHHHYDLGNEFYRLWLDQEMVYTCAYFPSPDVSLEEAQIAKMRHVCDKLGLRPGERVVEAGCGWGALALYMARHYGVSVKAFNLSHEQIRYARERAHREGLGDRVEFVEDDYRSIREPFDVFVSVGMLEHVGPDHYPALGEVIHRGLSPQHGRGLLHFIGRNQPLPLNAWIRQRIFPGAYPPTLPEVMRGVFEPWNLSVLDVENLRLHYSRTLQHWLARFDAAADRVASMFDQALVRAWRLYLAGSQAAFTTGWLQLFQVVFASGYSNQIPWTRAETVHEPRQSIA